MSSPDTVQPQICSIEDLHISFVGPTGGVPVVHGVSLSVGKGEIIGLIGQSGSGKSVTAMTIPGLLPPQATQIDQGTVRFGDVAIEGADESVLRTLRSHQIGVIFQEPMTALNPSMRIGAILREAALAIGVTERDEADALATTQLREVSLDDPDRVMAAFPSELSGGMRQRVVIALAFIKNPTLIIADEPTTALDMTVQGEILALIKDVAKRRGTAVLLISHDLSVVESFCDRIIVMKDGEVVEEGQARDLMTDPQHPYTQALIGCLPDRAVPRTPILQTEPGRQSGGDRLEYAKNAASDAEQQGQPILTAEHVSVRFVRNRSLLGRPTSYFDAVKDVSVTINKGETVSLIGGSGSGKTTLAKVLSGLEQASSGSVQAFGDHPGTVMRQGRLQFVFQDPRSSLSPRMPVWQIITEPLLAAGREPDPRQKAKELLDLVGLPSSALDRFRHQFSGGERQRLAIARALSTSPNLIVLDEPTSALDVLVQAQILDLMLELQTEFQLTYLIVTHDLAVARHLSDRLIVMRDGSIVEQGSVSEIANGPKDAFTRQLFQGLAASPLDEPALKVAPKLR
ncbi:MAG: ABC transporter ATP-binding protein [Pseudomonadota bacterium]